MTDRAAVDVGISAKRACVQCESRRSVVRRFSGGAFSIQRGYSHVAVAVGRKNYLFAGSHEAARRTAVLYSLTRTCAQHGVPPLPYFTDVLRKLREHVPVTDLLPDRWRDLYGAASPQ